MTDAPLTPFPAATVRRLRRRLLAWYDGSARDLPWRGIRDPYAIAVSEFMLQQTQVATVLPYYRRFLERFPGPADLAAASEADVRAIWSGLGYYRRARNLQKLAGAMVHEHGGSLPDSLDALRALPGVGDYTAAALGSFVHGLHAAVVDGNVVRVLTRLHAHAGRTDRTAVRRGLQTAADGLLDPGRPGDWNQAMMELGATICTPRAPACEACPWNKDCRARAAGEPERYPVKPPRRKQQEVERAVGVLRRQDRLLFVLRRDPRLLDGTWELPGVDLDPGAGASAALTRHLTGLWDRPARVSSELARVTHSITHRRFTVRAFAVSIQPLPRAHRESRRWLRPDELPALPTSSLTVKLVKALAPLLAPTRSD